MQRPHEPGERDGFYSGKKKQHTLARMRRFQALAQADRHHRWGHAMRVAAIAGLVNRQIRALA